MQNRQADRCIGERQMIRRTVHALLHATCVTCCISARFRPWCRALTDAYRNPYVVPNVGHRELFSETSLMISTAYRMHMADSTTAYAMRDPAPRFEAARTGSPPVQFLADASFMSHPAENCRTRMTP